MKIYTKTCVTIAAVLALSACAKPPEAPKPSQSAADTFKGCTWGEVRGKTLSMWTYTCGQDSSHIHLVADDTLPGFLLVADSQDAGTQFAQPVIRLFTKDAAAPIDAILPEIRNLSPGPHTDTCALKLSGDPTNPKSTRKLYELSPTGPAVAEWEEIQQTGEGKAPCGPMGVSFAGDHVFEVMPDDPTKVVYIDYGSEIQIFDTDTLKVIKAK